LRPGSGIHQLIEFIDQEELNVNKSTGGRSRSRTNEDMYADIKKEYQSKMDVQKMAEDFQKTKLENQKLVLAGKQMQEEMAKTIQNKNEILAEFSVTNQQLVQQNQKMKEEIEKLSSKQRTQESERQKSAETAQTNENHEKSPQNENLDGEKGSEISKLKEELQNLQKIASEQKEKYDSQIRELESQKKRSRPKSRLQKKERVN